MKLEKSVIFMTAVSLVLIVCAGLAVLYVQEQDSAKRASQVGASPTVAPTPDISLSHVPNEASKNCVDKGGTLVLEKNRQGKEYGTCVFPPKDGISGVCEEWALYKGKCPKGGLRIKTKVSDVIRYCLIGGGEFLDGGIDEQGNEKGKCYFFPKTECDMYDFFGGVCKPVELQ